MDDIKVSVIVPIFNVEAYIERCVVSLMEQTLSDVEYIFVDDASPDTSVNILQEVLKRYPARQSNVKIISHEENRGLSAARNSGLSIARGEYIYHCDSDDYVKFNMLELLYNKAKERDAEIVWCDFTMDYGDRIEYCKIFELNTDDKKQLIKNYLSYGWNVVWNMIAKRSIYTRNSIKCYDGLNFTEDFGLTARLVFYANNFAYIPQALYIYNRANQSSIVHQELRVDKRAQMIHDEITICDKIVSFYIEKGGWDVFKQELSWRILKTKRGWLYDSNKWDEYLNLYPESNEYITNNPFCSKKDKFAQYLILNKLSRPLLYIVKFVDKLYKRVK